MNFDNVFDEYYFEDDEFVLEEESDDTFNFNSKGE